MMFNKNDIVLVDYVENGRHKDEVVILKNVPAGIGDYWYFMNKDRVLKAVNPMNSNLHSITKIDNFITCEIEYNKFLAELQKIAEEDKENGI